jgi:drug/metabolite transporter (DMT)-like permease
MSAFTLAAILVIISGSLHATVNAMIKGANDTYLSATIMSMASTLFVLPIIPFFPLPAEAWGWLAIGVVIHAAYFALLSRTLDKGEFSAAYPIYRGAAPLLVALVTIGLLGDPVTLSALAGILLIGGGLLMMLIGKHVSREVLILALLTGAMTAGYTVIDAQGVRAVPDPMSFILWLFLFMGLVNMTLLPRLTPNPLGPAIRAHWRIGIGAGTLSLCTFSLALYALSLGPTAELAALRETGMITATVISITILGERVTMSRIAAIGAILIGALLILL